MLAACEAGEVFALLEGGAGGSRAAADALCALYGAVRESWLVRALLTYHARTGSARALDLLARAPDLHARLLLDALLELHRAPAQRRQALAALAPLVARRPPWLHRLAAHPLARDLLVAARHERDPPALLHALLALAALLPAAPALAAACPADLADALLRPAALEPPPAPAARAHLALAQRALFRALYATHPCTLLDALRARGADLAGAPRDSWERAVSALAECVRLHPALVTGSRTREADPARWARVEAHDVLAECRRLSLGARDEPPEPGPAPPAPPTVPPAAHPAAPGSGAHAARAAASLRPGGEAWFPLGERCGVDSAPPTPLPADVDVVEPPEAAVEATPENTPARETRAQFRFPTDSGAVRAIETSPSAPPGEGFASRLTRLALERRAVDSPVPFAGAPPPAGAAVARPEPSRPPPLLHVGAPPEILNGEDREVLELTACAPSDEEWADALGAGPRREGVGARDPRRPGPALAPRRTAPAPRRSRSCSGSGSGRTPGSRRCDAAVQTVDTWPEPYEFLIADFFRTTEDDTKRLSAEIHGASDRLDTYMAELYAGRGPARGASELGEQLALAHAQLMYERWRRDAHAERNRRLLGRCRQVRALELHNAALQDRVRALTRERDELRAPRRAPPPEPAPHPAPPVGLEEALAEERAARLRAEAALREAEACRAHDAAELQRSRGESFEAARHVEALARAALAAERRAEHVRRLRRELLLLAEREARLTAVTRGGLAAAATGAAAARAGADERMLRAALARAEAEAETASARAELSTARAHDLETQLATRDAQLAELKRSSRAAAEEHAARARALQDKYAALLCVVRTADVRALERLAAP